MVIFMEEWSSKEKINFRSLIKWKKFRIYMLKKADYKCAMCSTKFVGRKRQRMLNVHHIYEDEYDNLDPKNFVVCCSVCHDTIEKIYIKIINNTLEPEVYHEWIALLKKAGALPPKKLKQLLKLRKEKRYDKK